MSRFSRAGRLGGFVAIPILGAVSPLLAIPAITAMYGSSGWAAVAVGQSIGGAAAVLVELGWGMVGPQRIAATSPLGRRRVFAVAMWTKILAMLVVAPLVCLVAALITPAYVGVSVLSAIAAASLGLSASWYFLGTGRPSRILYTESLPKLVLVVASSAYIVMGGPLWVSPLALLVAAIGAPISALLFLDRQERRGSHSIAPTDIAIALKGQLNALGGRAISAIYIALPTALVSIFAVGAIAEFTAVERLMRMGLTVLQAFPNAMQKWVGSSTHARDTRSRVTAAVKVNIGLGVVSAMGFAVLAPIVGPVLFSGTVEFSFPLALAAAGVILFTCTSRATGGLGLVRFGRIGAVTTSAGGAAAVGIPAICILSIYGATGAMVGVLIAEVVALGIQVVALAPVLRRGKLSDAD